MLGRNTRPHRFILNVHAFALVNTVSNLVLVFSLKVHSLTSSDEKETISNTWSRSSHHGAIH